MNELTIYNEEQIALIKTQIAPKATNDELKLFLYVCQKTKLDPFSRQIYAIHRNTKEGPKMTIQTSIDGHRVIADRSGEYAGQSVPKFDYKEIGGKSYLNYAEIVIFKFDKQGKRYDAATGFAYWDEYVEDTPLWKKMPHNQLAKCAEANGLKKAFQNDIPEDEEIEESNEKIKILPPEMPVPTTLQEDQVKINILTATQTDLEY